MLLKAMMYQKDQHKMFNDRADIALTLANYISCCYLSSLTVVLTANIYLAFTCARYGPSAVLALLHLILA